LAHRLRRPATLNVNSFGKPFFRLVNGLIVTTMVFNPETLWVPPIGLPVWITGLHAYLSVHDITKLFKKT
jgi:hypothetical protein